MTHRIRRSPPVQRAYQIQMTKLEGNIVSHNRVRQWLRTLQQYEREIIVQTLDPLTSSLNHLEEYL